MDERLKTIAANAGLDTLLKAHPELIEAAWARARVYAERLPELALNDEPAHVFRVYPGSSSE